MQMYFKDLWWSFLLLAIGCYLIGNLNFAIIISRAKNRDITKEGSGNPGTMNMSRTFGLKLGFLTLILDLIKGALPTYFAKVVFSDMFFGDSTLQVCITAQYVAGLFVVLGHIFPALNSFKGGKGIAATIGVFLVTEPVVCLISCAVAFIYILITAMGAMGGIIAITPPAISALIELYQLGFEKEPIFEYGTAFFIITELIVFAIIFIVFYATRQNVKKLISGEEHQTGWLDMFHEKRMQRKRKRLIKKGIIPPDGD